jgi:hypothetical protein
VFAIFWKTKASHYHLFSISEMICSRRNALGLDRLRHFALDALRIGYRLLAGIENGGA